MPDFVAVFDDIAPSGERRPTLGAKPLDWHHRSWGWLGLARDLWRSVQSPERVDECRVAGRPCERGGGPIGYRLLGQALDGDAQSYARVSGMFLLMRVREDGLDVATDRFSHIPVYATPPSLGPVIVSTNVEWISELNAGELEIDEVSIAELLLWDNITFPHTTRRGVSQLAPGSVHQIRVDAGATNIESRSMWAPREPDRWPGKRECIERANAGVREAVAEIASSADRVGVSLSGGLDSRIVAATLARETHVEALTYLDSPNKESRSAARTAAVLGIPHHLIYRDPEFYADAFNEGQRLVGFEQNSLPCHSLCMVGHEALDELDVIVGGFGCDILMKGAYIPYGMFDIIRSNLGLRRLTEADRSGKHNYSHVALRQPLIRPEFVEAAKARRLAYEESIRSIRPQTAEEWIGFYPISHTTSIDSMAADRCMPHDEFYFRAGLVEASVTTPWIWKKGQNIISALGTTHAREVARLPHPDNGLPATWTYLPSRLVNQIRRRVVRPSSPAPREHPWFSDGSFVVYPKFFELAPRWKEMRRDAIVPETVDGLSRWLGVDVVDKFGRYSSEYDSLMNATILQVVRLLARGVPSSELVRLSEK